MPEMTSSNREAARRIGLTEAALRKAVAKGRITREPDGQWDIDKTRRRLIETADPVRSPLAGVTGAGTANFIDQNRDASIDEVAHEVLAIRARQRRD